MSGGNWQPGDLALCVKGGVYRACCCGAPHWGTFWRRGMVATVAAITDGNTNARGVTCPATNLVMTDCRDGVAARFVRIPPLTDSEKEEFLHELTDAPVKEVVQ